MELLSRNKLFVLLVTAAPSLGCITSNTSIDGKLGLVMLIDVPVPEGTIKPEGTKKKRGSDGGGALLMANFEAIESEALMETFDDEELPPDTYLEGEVHHWFVPFLIGYAEGTHFTARRVRVHKKELPPATTEAAQNVAAALTSKPTPEAADTEVETEVDTKPATKKRSKRRKGD